MRKFYRQTFEIEVLSEDKPIIKDLNVINYQITEGDCSGVIKEITCEEVPPEKMALLLISQGSDPEFFRLDEHGNFKDD
jgi:hypothetical protein